MIIMNTAGASLFCPECGKSSPKEYRSIGNSPLAGSSVENDAYNYFSCTCGKGFYFIVRRYNDEHHFFSDQFEKPVYQSRGHGHRSGFITDINPKSFFVKFKPSDSPEIKSLLPYDIYINRDKGSIYYREDISHDDSIFQLSS